MIMGHYATALLPFNKMKGAPIWLLLLCTQLGDLIWLLLALAGIEAPAPTNFLDVTIIGMKVAMPFSHTGLNTLLFSLATAGLVQAVWKDKALSLWCGVLVFVHWLCDLLCGWKHEILTPGTPKIGFDLYAHSPYLAFAIEIVFSAVLVAWFISAEKAQGRPLTRRAKVILYAAFVGGSTLFVPNAHTSFRTMFGG